MIEEHREVLATLQALVERAKGHAPVAELVTTSGALAERLLEHELREVKLARELV
jgi:hypothetical protein